MVKYYDEDLTAKQIEELGGIKHQFRPGDPLIYTTWETKSGEKYNVLMFPFKTLENGDIIYRIPDSKTAEVKYRLWPKKEQPKHEENKE